MITKTARVRVDASPEVTWRAIATLDRLSRLGLPGAFSAIDISTAKAGDIFECSHGGKRYQRKIVNWVQGHHLSIGNLEQSGWDHEFVIATSPPSDTTMLEYSRRMRVDGGMVLKKLFGNDEYQEIVDSVARNAQNMIPNWSDELVG